MKWRNNPMSLEQLPNCKVGNTAGDHKQKRKIHAEQFFSFLCVLLQSENLFLIRFIKC
jgi:hypothetical protein